MTNTNAEIKGSFVVKKLGLRIIFEKSEISFNYFDFEHFLFRFFDEEQIQKILYHLNNSEKILIDFDKHKIFLVEVKDVPFNKGIGAFLTKTCFEEFFENGCVEIENDMKGF